MSPAISTTRVTLTLLHERPGNGSGSALKWALQYSHVTVARKMLKEGALLSEYLHKDWEPLAMAWIYGPDAAVKIRRRKVIKKF